MSQPAEAVWKQQLQRLLYNLLSWFFQRCYSLDCYVFVVRFHCFHPVTESVSDDGLWSSMFIKFDCYCKIGTLCKSVCEHSFFLFQQNSCFSLPFIAIEKFFSPTRITYASVSDIKSMNSNADTPWTFPKRLLGFISPDYRSRISKKGWDFFFLLKNFSSRKRT